MKFHEISWNSSWWNFMKSLWNFDGISWNFDEMFFHEKSFMKWKYFVKHFPWKKSFMKFHEIFSWNFFLKFFHDIFSWSFFKWNFVKFHEIFHDISWLHGMILARGYWYRTMPRWRKPHSADRHWNRAVDHARKGNWCFKPDSDGKQLFALKLMLAI
jgi:hypothetical protein